MLRTGIGYDIHPLVTGRWLVLGGVEIPFARGLHGWSDADALTHAVIDALLGAAALGDIGTHFPPGEAQYRDISSLVLLERVRDKLAENSWRVVNIDATILAEKPRLEKFIPQMRQRLSEALSISPGQLSIKASTAAGLGAVGREEAIEAQAIVLIESV